MNTKITFLLLLVLIVILMLFYYADIESNIIILLGVTIVILIHNIISKREHFNSVDQKAELLSSKIDTLIAIAKAFQSRKESTSEDTDTIEGIPFNFSCPFNASGDETKSEIAIQTKFGNSGLVLPINSKLGQLTPDELLNAINQRDSFDSDSNN
jgi:hypothetical protein